MLTFLYSFIAMTLIIWLSGPQDWVILMMIQAKPFIIVVAFIFILWFSVLYSIHCIIFGRVPETFIFYFIVMSSWTWTEYDCVEHVPKMNRKLARRCQQFNFRVLKFILPTWQKTEHGTVAQLWTSHKGTPVKLIKCYCMQKHL